MLKTCQYVGHYLSAAVVVIGLVVFAASFVPALRGHLELATLAFALFPIVFALFAVTLFSLHETPKAQRPYRPNGLLSALAVPESWPRRVLLIGVMLATVATFAHFAVGPWSNPSYSEGNTTVEWNGARVPATQAKYERVRAMQDRPPLLIVVFFATFSYGILADVDSRHGDKPTD